MPSTPEVAAIAGLTPEDSRDRTFPAPHGYERWLWRVVVVFLLATIYGLTSPGNRSEADDAFSFAYDVEHKGLRAIFGAGHTAHLLFLPLARGLVWLVNAMGFDVRAYELVRFTNCLLAAVSIVLFRSLLRCRFHLSSFAATSGAAGLAVSYGFWRYACETEVYALAILLIVALCYLAFSPTFSPWTASATAFIAASGVLVHILCAIPAVVIAPLALLMRRQGKELVIYWATLVVIVGGVNLTTYRYSATPRERSFAEYALGTDPGPTYAWQAVPRSIASFGEDVMAGSFLFSYRGVGDTLESAFPAKYLDEEKYAGERAGQIVRTVPVVTFVLLFVLAVASVRSIARRLRSLQRRSDGARPLVIVSVWIGLFSAFLLTRSSAAPEAWIPLLPAVWTLVAAVAFQEDSEARVPRLLIVAFLSVLTVHNLVGGAWLLRSKSFDLNAVRAEWLLSHAGSRDVILTADGPVFFRYLRYYSRAQVVDLEGVPPADMSKTCVTADPHGRVYATAGVFDLPRPLRQYSPNAQAVAEFAARIRPRFARVEGTGPWKVYRAIEVAMPGTSGISSNKSLCLMCPVVVPHQPHHCRSTAR